MSPIKSKSKKALSQNISRLMEEGRHQKQARAIAPDVQPHIPEAVGKPGEDGMLGFYDRPVLAATVKAIQELHAKNEALESSHCTPGGKATLRLQTHCTRLRCLISLIAILLLLFTASCGGRDSSPTNSSVTEKLEELRNSHKDKWPGAPERVCWPKNPTCNGNSGLFSGLLCYAGKKEACEHVRRTGAYAYHNTSANS